MGPKSTIQFLLIAWILQSCSTTKNSVFWVSGIRSECSAGAGKTTCLNVYKGSNLEEADWEYFYAPIQGFEYEEGFIKKIKVKTEKLDPEKVPADASSIKYTLVKELEKRPDTRILLKGDWILTNIKGRPINRMVPIPTLQINLEGKRISGNGGCNTYSGSIEKMTVDVLNLGPIAGTLKACTNKNIEGEYHEALARTNTYKINDQDLVLYNKEGEIELSFIRAVQ